MRHTPWIIQDRKIKIAVLGLGRISKNHLQAIQQHSKHLELVAICDGREEIIRQAMEQYQVQAYLHLEDLLA